MTVSTRGTMALWILGALALGVGCRTVDPIRNPAFDVSVMQAESVLEQLRETPMKPERPILLIGGYFNATGSQIEPMQRELIANFGNGTLLRKTYFMFSNFDRLRDQLVEAVDAKFGPGDKPGLTVEVDAVALSMGGLVCRYAAVPLAGRRSLNLRRLYTVGTPHRGAAWGTNWSFDKLVRDMKIGSPFLVELESARGDASYTLVPYVRLGDGIVGEANAAPPGELPIWLNNLPGQRAHANALHDPRIQADILRRLRHLEPLAQPERSSLPCE